MNNEEAIKILENIEEEIAPDKFSSMDEYLATYQKRFIELFGVAKDDDPEVVKEARLFLEISNINLEQDVKGNKIMDFTVQRNRKQLLKYYSPSESGNQMKDIFDSNSGFIEMDYEQIATSLTGFGN